MNITNDLRKADYIKQIPGYCSFVKIPSSQLSGFIIMSEGTHLFMFGFGWLLLYMVEFHDHALLVKSVNTHMVASILSNQNYGS